MTHRVTDGEDILIVEDIILTGKQSSLNLELGRVSDGVLLYLKLQYGVWSFYYCLLKFYVEDVFSLGRTGRVLETRKVLVLGKII